MVEAILVKTDSGADAPLKRTEPGKFGAALPGFNLATIFPDRPVALFQDGVVGFSIRKAS